MKTPRTRSTISLTLAEKVFLQRLLWIAHAIPVPDGVYSKRKNNRSLASDLFMKVRQITPSEFLERGSDLDAYATTSRTGEPLACNGVQVSMEFTRSSQNPA